MLTLKLIQEINSTVNLIIEKGKSVLPEGTKLEQYWNKLLTLGFSDTI